MSNCLQKPEVTISIILMHICTHLFLPLKYGALLYQAVASFIVFSTSHFSVTIKTALPLHL